MKSSCVLLLTLLVFAAPAQAQTPADTLLLNAHRGVNGRLVKPFAARYALFARQQGQEKLLGHMSVSYEYSTWQGKTVGLKRTEVRFAVGAILDSGTVDRRTLLPFTHRSHQSHRPAPRTLSLDFAGPRVSGFNQEGSQRTAVELTATTALFDSFSADLLMQALPLRAGQAFKFAEYVYEQGGQVWVRGRVLGAQPLPQPAGEPLRPSWVVETMGRDQSTVTYWLDPRTRQLLQVTFVSPGREIILRREK